MSGVEKQLRKLQDQAMSIAEDNRRCMTLLVLLAVAFFVNKYCQCRNPVPDARKALRRGLRPIVGKDEPQA